MQFEKEHHVIKAFQRIGEMPIEHQKSTAMSTKMRELGDQQFAENNVRDAMQCYNQSLRWANTGTVNVSLAYASRATCFLLMGNYQECLIDIALAKEADYPEELLPTLESYKAECEEKLKTQTIAPEAAIKLSYPADEQHECLANVLEIRSNEEFGRHIVAKCDIDAGKTILVEEAFAVGAYVDLKDVSKARSFCEHCLCFAMNFIPCPKCHMAVFCGEKCMQADDMHQFICGAYYYNLPELNALIKTIFHVVNAFDSVDSLMEFVESALSSDRDRDPDPALSPAQFRYAMFLKASAHDDSHELHLKMRYIAYQCVISIPKIKALFDSEGKQRFLMHLVWQHKLILRNNLFDMDVPENPVHFDYMGNILSIFNHSCVPNVCINMHRKQLIVTTIRPAKTGEQMFVSYISKEEFKLPVKERQEILRDTFKFQCSCVRCIPCESAKVQRNSAMLNDHNYKFLTRNNPLRLVSSKENRSDIKQKCLKFLKKFGHLPPSVVFDPIIVALTCCYYFDYNRAWLL